MFTEEQIGFIQYITGDSKAKIQNDYYEWLNKFHPAPPHELDLNLIKVFGFIDDDNPNFKIINHG